MRNPEIDLALDASRIWAQQYAPNHPDPVEFGHKAALVYRAALETQAKAGDERVMAVALAALSAPAEALQLISQLALLLRPSSSSSSQTGSAGVEGSV